MLLCLGFGGRNAAHSDGNDVKLGTDDADDLDGLAVGDRRAPLIPRGSRVARPPGRKRSRRRRWREWA